MRRAFQTNRRSWLESDSCKWLTLQVESTFPNSLNKIVCFGLGTLGCSLGYIQERAHMQHALVETIADVQYPGAMLWHTLLPEAHDELAWPQHADPDSSRVRTMIQHYHQETFPRSQEIFSCRTDLSIYVRKSS
jgi:hypothetical protein